jgi:hypothetical protein
VNNVSVGLAVSAVETVQTTIGDFAFLRAFDSEGYKAARKATTHHDLRFADRQTVCAPMDILPTQAWNGRRSSTAYNSRLSLEKLVGMLCRSGIQLHREFG